MEVGNQTFLSFLLLVMKLRMAVNIENAATNQMAIEGIEKNPKRNKAALSKTMIAKIMSNNP